MTKYSVFLSAKNEGDDAEKIMLCRNEGLRIICSDHGVAVKSEKIFRLKGRLKVEKVWCV